MARSASEHPTELELMILKVLWESSPLPVREIRDRLVVLGRDVAHTTVITALNIMLRKKYVSRSPQKNSYLFSPRVTRDQVGSGFVGDVVHRIFDGSVKDVMLAVLETRDLNEADLQEIRRLIAQKSKTLRGDQP